MYLVMTEYDLQRSHKTVLQCNKNPTCIITGENGKQHLSLYYPHSAFALKLRAYISSVFPSLKCRMSVQLYDQSGMLMRYVSNYVSKFKVHKQLNLFFKKGLRLPCLVSKQSTRM